MTTIGYRHFFSMGTRFDLVVATIENERLDKLSNEIKNTLQRIEDSISNYTDGTVFSAINRQAFKKPVSIEKDIFSLVTTLLVLSQKTYGYFDFSIGKITAANLGDSVQMSSVAASQKLPRSCNESILLDKDSETIRFLTDSVSLDSGGFGKGYGLDRLKPVLDAHAASDLFISFGESAIMGKGRHPYGNAWRAGLSHLFNPGESIWSFDLQDEVLSVSGNTPANMAKYGRGHIVNPHTAEAVSGFSQVAVAGKHGLFAEALSTALYCAPSDMRQQIADNFPGYRGVIVEYNENNEAKISYTFGFL